MKIDGKQVHIRPRFCGKRHSAQLTEPALVLQGEIRKLSFPIVDMLFVRALSEWTTMTIPYSRLIKLRHGRRLWRWLGVFLGGCVAGLAGMALAVISADTGQWALVVGVALLATGTVTIAGDGFPTVVVDFGRDSSLTVAKTGAAQWTLANVLNGTASPSSDIEAWQRQILKKSGATVTDIVFTTSA